MGVENLGIDWSAFRLEAEPAAGPTIATAAAAALGTLRDPLTRLGALLRREDLVHLLLNRDVPIQRLRRRGHNLLFQLVDLLKVGRVGEQLLLERVAKLHVRRRTLLPLAFRFEDRLHLLALLFAQIGQDATERSTGSTPARSTATLSGLLFLLVGAALLLHAGDCDRCDKRRRDRAYDC